MELKIDTENEKNIYLNFYQNMDKNGEMPKPQLKLLVKELGEYFETVNKYLLNKYVQEAHDKTHPRIIYCENFLKENESNYIKLCEKILECIGIIELKDFYEVSESIGIVNEGKTETKDLKKELAKVEKELEKAIQKGARNWKDTWKKENQDLKIRLINEKNETKGLKEQLKLCLEMKDDAESNEKFDNG